MTADIDVLQRAAPAAHVALVGTVLIDTGATAPGNVERVVRFLDDRPVELIALTHAHNDHAGGAAALRERLGAPVALHPADRETLTRDAARLGQHLEAFTVDRELVHGEILPGGIEVIPTPSQTPGHVAFWIPARRTVLSGDLVQAGDVAWLPFDDDVLDLAIGSVRRIAALEPAVVIPGHGPAVTDVATCVARTVAVYERWRHEPQRRVRHTSRRLVAGWLAACLPRPDRATAIAELASLEMLVDAAAHIDHDVDDLVRTTIDQLIASGAIADLGDHLAPRFPHETPAD